MTFDLPVFDTHSGALSEIASKKLLANFGIPTTREALAQNASEAAAMATEIGFPVVMKACSAQLSHKSDIGAVHLSIGNATQARAVYKKIVTDAPMDLEGVLVQEMIPGNRELVAGLHREPQFGPCVMLGLGGVLVEVLNESVFRLAPIDKAEAQDMIDELKFGSITGPFRGQAPADRSMLCTILCALGDMALQYPQITEIDINPLIIAPNGTLTAVDALVVLEGQ